MLESRRATFDGVDTLCLSIIKNDHEFNEMNIAYISDRERRQRRIWNLSQHINFHLTHCTVKFYPDTIASDPKNVSRFKGAARVVESDSNAPLTLSLPSSKSTFSQPFEEKRILSEVVRNSVVQSSFFW